MKKYKKYSTGFKEQDLVKVYSRSNEQSIQSIANSLNMNLTTLISLLKKNEQSNNNPKPQKSKRPEDWSPEERLAALQQSYGLFGEDLNAWCRERGLFAHQLEQWKANFCSPNEVDRQREDVSALRALKVEYQNLERELLRKDKALAEAAALLVLQKKFRALLGGEVE